MNEYTAGTASARAPRWTIRRHASVTSTGDLAARLACDGWDGGLHAIVADEQTAGRGTKGRAWASPPGGLWVTALLPLAPLGDRRAAADHAVGLGIRAAVCAAEALARASGIDCRVRWPNDIVARDPADPPDAPYRKLGGCLCELLPGTAGWVASVGIGLNLNISGRELAQRLRDEPQAAPTSIIDLTARPVDSEAVLALLLDKLASAGRASGLRGDWHERALALLVGVGDRCRLRDGTGVIHEGTLVGLADDAGAILLDDDARRVVVRSGEQAGRA